MLGKVIEIVDNTVTIKLAIDISSQPNLINYHIVFDDGNDKKVVAQIINCSQTTMKATIVGELSNGAFTQGASVRPSFKSKPRIIKTEELSLVLGDSNTTFGTTNFGTSNVYEGYKINVELNEFFSNHFSILGNSGSGKSCTVASILQKLFTSSPKTPKSSSLFFFDAYGEYTNAFGNINEKNPEVHYKSFTTNVDNPDTDILRIPIWLLDVDDLSLLLDVNSPSQLPILEKTLKLVPILTGTSANIIKRKNDIIARAIQDILLSGNESTKIRDQVTAVLTKFNTAELNLESQIVQPGYVRSLKQCLFVDKSGKMQEMELVVEFIRGYISSEDAEIAEEEMNQFYTLKDLELAMDFALISEGILKSEKVFDYANILSVRLHTLCNGEYAEFFNYPKYVTREQFINDLVVDKAGYRCQLINFNINYIDDRLAKVITKILSRMLFLTASTTSPRGSRAFHIIIEEAHRYVQHDNDIELLGYNIFERIAKEGRKYGIFLGLISQRPSELSDTCISQCMNFVILRTLHPKDLKYIEEMVPSISSEVVAQLKNLKPGNCIAFGSAFKVPIPMYIDLPDPRPLSNNVDLTNVWFTEVVNSSGIITQPVITDAAIQQEMTAVSDITSGSQLPGVEEVTRSQLPGSEAILVQPQPVMQQIDPATVLVQE